MDTLKLGRIITDAQQKDAVHIAVAPVFAAEQIGPGRHVALNGNLAVGVERGSATAIGIVDPFLNGFVEKGQRFWLFLYPGSITSLRHNWTHPAFANFPDPICQCRLPRRGCAPLQRTKRRLDTKL